MKLRSLPRGQMLIAEKLINDTLFLAEMGQLNLSHKLVSDTGEPSPNKNQFWHQPQTKTIWILMSLVIDAYFFNQDDV